MGRGGIEADSPDIVYLGKPAGDDSTVNLQRDEETLNLRLITLASSQRFCLSVGCLSVPDLSLASLL